MEFIAPQVEPFKRPKSVKFEVKDQAEIKSEHQQEVETKSEFSPISQLIDGDMGVKSGPQKEWQKIEYSPQVNPGILKASGVVKVMQPEVEDPN